MPFSVIVIRKKEHPGIIRRQFNSAVKNRRHTLAPNAPKKESKFQNDILARAKLEFLGGIVSHASFVIRCQQNDCKANFRMSDEFLNNRSASICLFVKNDGLSPRRDTRCATVFFKASLCP